MNKVCFRVRELCESLGETETERQRDRESEQSVFQSSGALRDRPVSPGPY